MPLRIWPVKPTSTSRPAAMAWPLPAAATASRPVPVRRPVPNAARHSVRQVWPMRTVQRRWVPMPRRVRPTALHWDGRHRSPPSTVWRLVMARLPATAPTAWRLVPARVCLVPTRWRWARARARPKPTWCRSAQARAEQARPVAASSTSPTAAWQKAAAMRSPVVSCMSPTSVWVRWKRGSTTSMVASVMSKA
ncbi:hypothetical protein D3C71_1320410 [compost metagenome]